MAEIRRVVQHGGGVSINLPKRFVVALGLRIGDHVICEIIDERIQVHKLNTAGVKQWVSQSERSPS